MTLLRLSDPKPEYLHDPDGQTAWVPIATQRFDAETRQFVPAELSRGQAKQQALHDVTSFYDWRTLRCRKVWMRWRDDDDGEGREGGWMEVPKGTPGAHPYWRVEETNRVR